MSGNIKNTLKQGREETHRAIQLVGSFPRNFLPYDPSDASASLIWNDQISGFETQEVKGIKVGFNLIEQSILLLKDDTVNSTISTINETFELTFSTLSSELEKMGFEVKSFNYELPYELPRAITNRGNPFTRQDVHALKKLVELYSLTNSILSEVFKVVDEASDIRCWPHHYDLATLVTVEAHEDPEKAKSIGFGFSPGDGDYDEPYFYLTPWPYPSANDLYELTTPAFWNTDGWTGGVLKALDVPHDKEKTIITNFFESGFKKLKPIL